MNNTIDIISAWAYKLTYRILQLSGASQVSLDNYVKGVKGRNSELHEADRDLSAKLPGVKILTVLIIILGTVIVYRLIQKRI